MFVAYKKLGPKTPVDEYDKSLLLNVAELPYSTLLKKMFAPFAMLELVI